MTKIKIEKKVFNRNNWRAGYIERCKSGSEGGIQRPTLRTKQGVGCLPYFDQAKEKGWHVKPGEKGTHIEFYKFDEKTKVDEFGDPVLDSYGNQEVEKSVLVRIYVVFHASQIEGITPYEPKARNPIETSEKAQRILKESGAEIRQGGNDAFYSLMGDYIQVPERDQFKTQADYYSTALHELGHWTGHPSRLNRDIKRYKL